MKDTNENSYIENLKELNDNSINGVKEEENEFLLYPTKITRRLLSFLGDLFIILICATFIFEIVGMNIIRAATDFIPLQNNYTAILKQRYDIIYDNNVLYYEKADDKYNYDSSLSFSADMAIKYYCYSSDASLKKYDTLYNYWVSKKNDTEKNYYLNVLKVETNEVFIKYFTYSHNAQNDSYTIALRNEYLEYFRPKFEEGNAMSETGLNAYETFKKEFYNAHFYSIMNDLNISDNNFIQLTHKLDDITKQSQLYYMINAFISYFVTCIGFFLIYPLIDKKGRTLAQAFLKLERIKVNTIQNPNTSMRVGLFFLNSIECLPILMFIPCISVGFGALFSISTLFIVTLCGLVYDVISLVLSFANSYNKSIKELVTLSIVCDSSLIDELFIKRGYGA